MTGTEHISIMIDWCKDRQPASGCERPLCDSVARCASRMGSVPSVVLAAARLGASRRASVVPLQSAVAEHGACTSCGRTFDHSIYGRGVAVAGCKRGHFAHRGCWYSVYNLHDGDDAAAISAAASAERSGCPYCASEVLLDDEDVDSRGTQGAHGRHSVARPCEGSPAVLRASWLS